MGLDNMHPPVIVAIVVQPTRTIVRDGQIDTETCAFVDAELFSLYLRDFEGTLHWQADCLNLDFACQTARYWGTRFGVNVEAPIEEAA